MTMRPQTRRWQYLGRASRNTHKFYRETATGRIAVADLSGQYPHETDDGVLYLDETRKIALYDEGYGLPLVKPDGSACWTPLTKAQLVYVIRRWPDLWPTSPEVTR